MPRTPAPPEQYRWSSAAAHLGIGADRSGLLNMEFWVKSGGAAHWQEMLAVADQSEAEDKLRRATYAGRPFGEAAFVERLAATFQRHWRPAGEAPAPDEGGVA